MSFKNVSFILVFEGGGIVPVGGVPNPRNVRPVIILDMDPSAIGIGYDRCGMCRQWLVGAIQLFCDDHVESTAVDLFCAAAAIAGADAGPVCANLVCRTAGGATRRA